MVDILQDSKPYLIVALIFISTCINAQNIREMRGSLNTRSYNDTYPAISGDGSVVVFMNDYTNDGSPVTMVSRKESGGRWNRATEIGVLNPARLNVPGGHALSFDGNTLIFSSRKGEVVGGFDLWMLEYGDGGWGSPKNLRAPVNSSMQDSYPALSPDGNQLYFTRCRVIEGTNASDCKIFVSEKKRGRSGGWDEPQELPSSINAGNTLMPRLLADNKTLVFLSDKAGGSGGLDWYQTRLQKDGSWSEVINMRFVNTPEDDLFYSTYYRPDRAVTSRSNDSGKLDVVEIEVPSKFQPEKVVIKLGKVLNDNNQPVDSDVRVRDLVSGETVTFTFPDVTTGDYTIIIPEGSIYDFSIVPKRGNEFYYSEILRYESLRSSRREFIDFHLKSPSRAAVLPLAGIRFEDNSDALTKDNEEELKRLVRLLNRNSNYNFEILSYQDSVAMDSIPHTHLTEVIADTTEWEELVYEYEYKYQYDINEDSVMASFPEFSSTQLDSILYLWNDSLQTAQNDTILADLFMASLVGVDTIEHIVDTLQHVDIKYTYHNDLTEKRAKSLMSELSNRGVKVDKLTAVGYGDKEPPKTPFEDDSTPSVFVEIVFRQD